MSVLTMLKDSEFRSKVISSPIPVLVDFSATWCGPCQKQVPILEEVARDLAGKIQVYKMDVDEARVGECAALNAPDIAPDEVHRGLVLAHRLALERIARTRVARPAQRRVSGRMDILRRRHFGLGHTHHRRLPAGTGAEKPNCGNPTTTTGERSSRGCHRGAMLADGRPPRSATTARP